MLSAVGIVHTGRPNALDNSTSAVTTNAITPNLYLSTANNPVDILTDRLGENVAVKSGSKSIHPSPPRPTTMLPVCEADLTSSTAVTDARLIPPSPHLDYIPPGLTCELGIATIATTTTSPSGATIAVNSDGNRCGAERPPLLVRALGRFAIGHVWGPYMVHWNPECALRLKNMDEQVQQRGSSNSMGLNLTVKNSIGISLDANTIMLGEEHTWIKLLYESGLRANSVECNADLVVNLSSKTITLLTTKELAPNDVLRGALRVRSAITKSPALMAGHSSSNTISQQQQQQQYNLKSYPPTTNLVCLDMTPGTIASFASFTSMASTGPSNCTPVAAASTATIPVPTAAAALSSTNATGPRRDKKCTYCGIPFSNVDTLTAHMTHYCSRRPQLVTSTPPTSISTMTTTGSSSTSTASIAAAAAASSSSISSSSSAMTVTNSIVGDGTGGQGLSFGNSNSHRTKRPTSRPSNATSSLSNPIQSSITSLPTNFPSTTTTSLFGSLAAAAHPRGSTAPPSLSDHSNQIPDSLAADARFAQALLNSFHSLTADASSAAAAAAAASICNASMLPNLTRWPISHTPTTLTAPPRPMILDTHPAHTPMDKPSETDVQSPQSNLNNGGSFDPSTGNDQHLGHTVGKHGIGSSPSDLSCPIHCTGCQRFFATEQLYTCHLRMSAHLVAKQSESVMNNSNSGSSSAAIMDDPFQLAAAATRLGLTLAAPLVTGSGLQFVPINPSCGLLAHCSKSPTSTRKPSVYSSSSRSKETHHVIPSQSGLTNVLDLSCSTHVTRPSGVLTNGHTGPLDVLPDRLSPNLLCDGPRTASGPATQSPAMVQLFHQLLATIAESVTPLGKPPVTEEPPSEQNTTRIAASSASNNLGTASATTTNDAIMASANWPLHMQQMMNQLCLAEQMQHTMHSPATGGSASSSQMPPNMALMEWLASMHGLTNGHLANQKTGPPPDVPRGSDMVPSMQMLHALYQSAAAVPDFHGTSSIVGEIPVVAPRTPQKGHAGGTDVSASPVHSPQPTTAAAPLRPYLCNYCQTRFQAFTTFQAHQQYYCQARRDSVRHSTQQVTSGTTPAVTGNNPTTPTPIPTPTRSSSPLVTGCLLPPKRRRVLPVSPTPTTGTDPAVRSSAPCSSASNSSNTSASSAAWSGDETDFVERGSNHSPPTTPRAESTNSTIPSMSEGHCRRLADTSYRGGPVLDLESHANGSIRWEKNQPMGGELQCSACGYVGQTARGMKMHKRLHECGGGTGMEQRETKPIMKRASSECTSEDLSSAVSTEPVASRFQKSEEGEAPPPPPPVASSTNNGIPVINSN